MVPTPLESDDCFKEYYFLDDKLELDSQETISETIVFWKIFRIQNHLLNTTYEVSCLTDCIVLLYTGCPRKIDTERNLGVRATCGNMAKNYRWMLS